MILSALSTENEEFPGWDGFDKGGAVVPSWDFVVDIWISPFFGLEVENPNVVVLHFSVPSSIDIDLLITGEQTVSTSSIWRVVVWNELLPSFFLEVEAVKVIESNTGVVETSMSSEDIDFLVVNASSAVCSWSWSSACGVEVLNIVLILPNSFPFHGFDLKEPCIVESGLWAMMTTKDEHLVTFWGAQGHMLGSSQWLL